MFAKVNVNGPGAHPLWQYLARETVGENKIKNYFHKFLINQEHKLMSHHPPTYDQDKL
jgi:glutathione peroxidase